MALACGLSAAEMTVLLNVDPAKAGAPLPSNFCGLSFEVALVLPGPDGVHYFRPDNQPLLRLFRTLGIKSLRIGGNTSDRDAKQLPTEADLDSLFGFAKAAGLKVIYCLQLHNGKAQEDASIASYIMVHHSEQVDCFSIGQEPSAYPVEKKDLRPNSERMGGAAEKYRYEDYRTEWKAFADTIIAAAPNVKFCGPSIHNNGEWARRFMADFGRSNHVGLITEHLYPGGACGKVPSPEIGRDRMLSADFVKAYEKLYAGFVPMAISNSLPYRLEEVNNYFNGGATDVSDTFASALWGLDFMYWWAEHDAAGINFHTGDRVAAGSNLRPSKYTAFFSTTNGYLVRPLGYGLKAFALANDGRLVPVSISGERDPQLSVHGVLAPDQSLVVTIINKEHVPAAANLNVELNAGQGYVTAQSMLLQAPTEDVAAKSGITLGGSEIMNDATWAGHWKPLTPAMHQTFTLKVPAATAALVRLSRRREFP
ncbi:MAG TPA: hypothetical protein VLT36_13810 [Candidatus Dormibacteraeota bacterium]|nr:hypothetical protein [Candidatus Dormibacteraeota bacterium]